MEEDYLEDDVVENVTDCPSCGAFSAHEILKKSRQVKNRLSTKCSDVIMFTLCIRPPKPVAIPFL